MKKLIAILLTMILVLSFGAAAFAEETEYSITITNAKEGETYTAYKMFDLSVNDPQNPTAYTYSVIDAWNAFKTYDAFKAAFNVDDQGYVTAKAGVESETEWVAGSVMSNLAEAAAKFAKENNIAVAASETADADGDVKLNVGGAGYYVISSTLGTRAMIETTPDNTAVSVNEKNEEDTIEKQVKEGNKYVESNDAQIGDKVEFKSIATITPRSINVKIHDTMTSGLTFNEGSIKIFTDAELTTELTSLYEILANPDAGDTFTIKIEDAFAATATEAQTLYITYTATLNENVVEKREGGVIIVDQTNTTKISFGDGSSAEDVTTTTTHKFSVFKHATNKTENLAGAVFSLKKAGAVVKLIKLDDNNYRVANGAETGVVDTFTTVESGDIVIWGVDAADYFLEETKAPAGYNKLAQEVPVKVGAENSTRADVENKSGNELPSTGGIGTTIFYVLGGLMVTGAVVVLVSKKRMEQ